MTQTAAPPNGHSLLLDPHELAQAAPPEAIPLPVELIDPNPRNPRARLPEVDALAASIKQFGLLQPIFARRVGERYEILGGHRRFAAYAKLRESEPLNPEWRTIPVRVRSFDDERAYLALITSQVHSQQWKPREEAAALEQLVAGGRTVEQVGQAVNRSYAWASKRLRIYSDSILSAFVQSGRLSTGVAEELIVLRDLDTRRDFAERAVKEGWSQDQARARVRTLRIDHQLSDLGKRAREMVDLLGQVEGPRISLETFRDLWTLHGRVEVLAAQARGDQPRVPSIAEAEKVAGVTPAAKDRAERQRKERQRAARKARRVSTKA